jgi:hypothetical protein
MTKKIEKNALAFIKLMIEITIRIASYDKEGKLIGRSSGFLYKKNSDSIPIVITAGHKLPEEGSFIETNIVKDGSILQINAGKFNVFHNHDDIDYAYSELPVDLYKKEIEKYDGICLRPYNNNFTPIDEQEAYGFAVVNDYLEFVKLGDINALASYSCYEVGLEFIKQNEHINYFKPLNFQGHEFYRGASGSPVADPEGKITGIIIGGTEEGLLRVFRLDNIDFSIGEDEVKL